MSVDSLEFKLILNDEEFNRKIKEVTDKAKDMNADLSKILEATRKLTLVTDDSVKGAKNYNKILKDNAKVQEDIRKKTELTNIAIRKANATANSEISRINVVNREKEALAAAKTALAQERVNKLMREGNAGLLSSSKLWSQIGTYAATYFSLMGAERLIRALVQTTAEFELQRVTLGAILQDAEKAQEIYGQIKDLAVVSPFSFKELMTYTKQLSAFSVPMEELYDTTKMLADVSAGLGVGMDRLILAYGQIRSASFLRGQEVRQLTEAGVPILEELRKKFVELGEEGITVGDVFDKISRRMVPFQMVADIFNDMTSEGGKFYQMQEVQAETLKGKLTNLTDAYQIMFSEIGDKKSGFLKGTVDTLRSIAENYQKVGRIILELVATYGAYKSVVKATHIVEQLIVAQMNAGTNAAKHRAATIKVLENNFRGLASVLRGIKNINPWGVLVAGVAAVATGLITAAVQAKRFRDELNNIANSKFLEADKSAKDFDKLADRLREATVGSQDYRDAISELNRKYGEYLPNLLNEKNALDEIATAEEKVKNAIYARARAYAEAEIAQKIEDKQGKELNAYTSLLQTSIRNNMGVSDDIAVEFVQNLRDAFIANEDSFKTSVVTFTNIMKKYFGEAKASAIMGKEWYQYLREHATSYAKALQGVVDEEKKWNNVLDARFDNKGYSSFEQREAITEIEMEYAQKEQDIRNSNLSSEEAESKLLTNKLAKLNAILTAYERLNDEAAKAGKPGTWDVLIAQTKKQIEALTPKDSSWLQKIINPLIPSRGHNDLKAQVDINYNEYIDNLRKEYKSIVPALNDTQNTYNKLITDQKKGIVVEESVIAKAKEELEYDKKRKEVIEAIGKALGVTVNDKITTKRGSGKTQEQINLEIQRDTIKDIYNWYKKFTEAGMSEGDTAKVLVGIFPDQSDIINASSYETVLIGIANALQKYDKAAAQSLLDDLGVGDAKSIYDAYVALQKFTDEVSKLLAKDYGLEGTGLEYKISKILTGLTSDNASSQVSIDKLKKQVDEQEAYIKAATKGTEAEKEAAWVAYKNKAYEVLGGIYEKEKEYNQKSAQEKITQLAQSAVKDNYATLFGAGSKALSDWGDKTLGQINDIISKLSEARDGADTMISTDLISKANELGISFEYLLEAIKQIIGADLDNALTEKIKKAREVATSTKEILSSVSSIIGDVGENIDSQILVGISDAMGMVDDIADIILGSEDAIVEIFKSTEEAAEDADNIAKSFSVITMIVKVLLVFVERIADIWNGTAEAEAEAAEKAREYQKALLDVNATSQDGIFGDSQWRNILTRMEEYRKSFKSLVNEVETVYRDGGILGKAIGSYFIDDNGLFSLEKTMASYEAGLLSDETADIIENVKTLQDAIADIFGQISDDIVENMVTAFEETGDAVSNLEDAFVDMGETLVKSILKSYILEVVLNKYKDRIYGLIDEYNAADNKQSAILSIVEKIGDVFSQMSDEIEGLGPFINALLEKGQEIFGSFGSSSSDTLASGISAITEDTANLLASYVNAIRADVASTRLVTEGISTDVKAILGLLPTAPTLAEYLTKIEANTFNSALSTADILAEIRSMMTNERGETALRVYM